MLQKTDARAEKVSAEQLAFVEAVRGASTTLESALAFTKEFFRMFEEHNMNALDPRLGNAEGRGL